MRVVTLLIVCVVMAGFVGDPGPSSTLDAAPPAGDASVVLFDGTSWDAFLDPQGEPSPWEVQKDGSVLVTKGNAISRETFGDHRIHVEFRCPEMPDKRGQARGNSGVYVHGRYEVQVLDTFGLPPAANGCGGIYSIAEPLVNASRPPGAWQTYDIVFRAPRFEGDALKEKARITVFHNGVVIHANLELPHPTPAGMASDIVATGPLMLQDHGNPVRYRNVWVRRLD